MARPAHRRIIFPAMSAGIPQQIRAVVPTRNLTLLWAGQVISMSGDSIYQIALLWFALDLTASKTITGLVAMSSYLPTLFLSLVAGVVADRADRRRVMLWADAVRTAAVFGIPLAALFGILSPWVLVLNAFVIASAAAFFNPSRDAIIPQLVPSNGLLRANSLIQTSWQLALLLGPAVAGVLLQWLGLIPLFVVDAGAYACSFASIWLLRPQTALSPVATLATTGRQGGSPEPPGLQSTARGPHAARIHDGWQDILSGLRYAAGHAVIFPLLLITVADNLFIMGPAIVGMPVMVRDSFHGTASSYALLAMAFAIGMLLATIALVAGGSRIPKGKMLLWGMVFDGFTFIPYFFAQNLLQLGILSVFHGMAVPLLTVSRASLVQEVVPVVMRGRIFALISLAVVGMSAISSGLTGMVLEAMAAPTLFLVIGTVGGFCGVVGLLFARRLRQQA